MPAIGTIFDKKDIMKQINLIKMHNKTLKKVSSQMLSKKQVTSLKQIYKQKT